MPRLIVFLFIYLFSTASAVATDAVVHLSNIIRAPVKMTTAIELAGVDEHVYISNPIAIGAKGNLVYIVDASKPLVYRYNRASELITPLYSVNAVLLGIPNAITVDDDGSFYISDSFAKKVHHFNMQGELLRSYESPYNITSPVAVNIAASGNVLIADRLFGHVVVFNHNGQALRAFGEQGSGKGKLLEVIDMFSTPNGIYVLDRLSESVKVFSEDGELLREIQRPEVIDPSAITVDHAERIYISDNFDDTIKVYNQSGLQETFGGNGTQDGMFRLISDLHADNNFLYVADSGNDRVQVFLLNPAMQNKLVE